jgi:hypothetical protein
LLGGHYPASSLVRAHPPPSRRQSTSRLSRLYDLPCSGDFAPGRGGLLQLLGMSLPPCCRFHPAEVKVPRRSDFGTPCCLRPSVAGSALGSTHFRGHIHVHCRYGPVIRDLPTGDLVDGLQGLGFPLPCHPNYGASDSLPRRVWLPLNTPAFTGHTTGLEPLDSSGSCHRMKAAAFHLNIGFLPLPVDPSKWRWPAPFAPRALPRFITTTEQSAPSRRISTFCLAV